MPGVAKNISAGETGAGEEEETQKASERQAGGCS